MFTLLRWLTDASLADSIAGDLAEERSRRAMRARIPAALWLLRASLAVMAYLVVRKVRETIRTLVATGFGFTGGRHEWRQAVRSLRRTPWYSLTVVSVIALSMTLATTVFAIVDGVLFKPLPYPRAAELYTVGGPYSLVLSSKQIREWAEAVPDTRVAMLGRTFTIGSTTGDWPAPVTGAEVGPGFFDVLGVRPFIGGFLPAHFAPSAGRVPAIVSNRLWRRMFGGEPDVIGQPLDFVGTVNHLSRPLPGLQVVGVLPHDFVFPNNTDTPDVILPLALSPQQDAEPNESAALALVRIPAGVSPESVRVRINGVARMQGFRDANADIRGFVGSPDVSMYPVVTTLTLYTASSFRTAFTAAIVLVLIAVVNVSSLALARGRQRRSELALRQALGAGRWRLARLALQETAPLVVAGTIAGISGAPPLIRAITSVMGRIALLKTPEIDWRVVTFAALTAVVLTAVSVAATTRAVPSHRVGSDVGRGAAVTARRGWSAFSLVSVQVALTMVLAVGGALVLGSLWWAWRQDPGIDPQRVVLLDVNTGAGSTAERTARFNAAFDRVKAVPGVQNTAAVNVRFLTRGHTYGSFTWPDGVSPNREESIMVSGDFFSTLGMRALEGRLPTAEDLTRDADIAVVGARVARAHWPGRSAVGQVFQLRTQMLRIVAVVPDARLSSLDDASYSQVYMPLRGIGGVILVKGSGNSDALLRSALAEVRAVGPPVGVTRALTLDAAYGDAIQSRTFYAWFFGGFAACALVIVAVGIIGLVAMTTAMRTREMGIRTALGATRDSLVGLLLGEQMRAVAVGVLAGGLVASWSMRYMKAYLYQFTVYDARLWTIAIATILATATLGVLVPALRASRVDPVTALRVD